MVDYSPIISERLLSVGFQKQHTTDGLVTRKSFLLRLRRVFNRKRNFSHKPVRSQNKLSSIKVCIFFFSCKEKSR